MLCAGLCKWNKDREELSALQISTSLAAPALLPDLIIHQYCFDFGRGPVVWMTCSYSTSDLNGCVFTKVSLLLPYRHAHANMREYMIRVDKALHPHLQSPVCSIWPKQFSWIAQANHQLYKWRAGCMEMKALQLFTTSHGRREGEGMAWMPRHSLQFAARTCWFQSIHYKLFVSICKFTFGGDCGWCFGKRQWELMTMLKASYEESFLAEWWIFAAWVHQYGECDWCLQ